MVNGAGALHFPLRLIVALIPALSGAVGGARGIDDWLVQADKTALRLYEEMSLRVNGDGSPARQRCDNPAAGLVADDRAILKCGRLHDLRHSSANYQKYPAPITISYDTRLRARPFYKASHCRSFPACSATGARA